ncbi:helix-turn-helix domain-containing protein [Solibacillus sp. FSL K6-1523]|uniref:helix-turn-helix domain-containing protein n=1 Tax=Solibacillus sp. FSL K6-1523 TaxID=2921471 RepID=UPI0030F67E6F
MIERLKEIREYHKLNQSDFAKSLGMGQSTLAMLEVGKRELLDRHIKTVCSIYNVNETWLRTGIGEMFIQPDTFSLDEYAKKSNLSDLEIAIMKGYMDLDRNVRETLLNHVEVLFKSRAETAVTIVEDPIEAELNRYRQELEAEQKGVTLSVSGVQKKNSI